MILHLPHAATAVPDPAGYLVDEETLQAEITLLTDHRTDDLFAHPSALPIRADFSRVFCDVERFADDDQEEMAAVGMGVLYERLDSGEPLRHVTPDLREAVLRKHYRPHHARLTAAVDAELQATGRALIVDGHSFASTPFRRDKSKRLPRPDFNLGTDAFHTPAYLVEASEAFFAERGYSLGIDWPYDGALVPLKHFRKTRSVAAVMLEVNRALYLEEPGPQKSARYDETAAVVRDYLTAIREAFARRSAA